MNPSTVFEVALKDLPSKFEITMFSSITSLKVKLRGEYAVSNTVDVLLSCFILNSLFSAIFLKTSEFPLPKSNIQVLGIFLCALIKLPYSSLLYCVKFISTFREFRSISIVFNCSFNEAEFKTASNLSAFSRLFSLRTIFSQDEESELKFLNKSEVIWTLTVWDSPPIFIITSVVAD